MICRHCETKLELPLIDLGSAPASNAYLREEDLDKPEAYFPLRVKVCHQCWLVQTEDFTQREDLFSPDYAYFSSASHSWIEHSRKFATTISNLLGLDGSSLVVEIASNDGYLLKNFKEMGIPCLGVEPASETANAAEALGIRVRQEFFGESVAEQIAFEDGKADLIVGNNVYAHVPEINDFTRGLKVLLGEKGTITLEFPHLLRLIEECQFDTIYHEHFSYLSLSAVSRIFDAAGLRIFDVEELGTHGGSLRVYGAHSFDDRPLTNRAKDLLQKELVSGLESPGAYEDFQDRAIRIRNKFTTFLIESQEAGELVLAYGAAAKGNTLLNYAGIRKDLLPVVFDASPAKQGLFLPGTQIPIRAPEELALHNASRILVLPWNLSTEIEASIKELVSTECEFVSLPLLTGR